jgi:hypothetical protein
MLKNIMMIFLICLVIPIQHNHRLRKSIQIVNLQNNKNIAMQLDDLFDVDFTKDDVITPTAQVYQRKIIKTDNPGLDSIMSLYNMPAEAESQNAKSGKFYV